MTLRRSGQLAIQPATLAQVAADEKLLRRLDVDQTHVYGVKASDLKHVVVMLEASPTYLARRMKLLESRLVGPQKMVLTTSPTAQAEHWKAVAHVAEVRLWLWPFETLDRRCASRSARACKRGWPPCCRSTRCRRRRCGAGGCST